MAESPLEFTMAKTELLTLLIKTALWPVFHTSVSGTIIQVVTAATNLGCSLDSSFPYALGPIHQHILLLLPLEQNTSGHFVSISRNLHHCFPAIVFQLVSLLFF